MNLGDYLEELKKIKMLDAKEEAHLWRRYKEAADKEARRVLIESYQPLVFKAVAAFKAADNIMDVVQEGTVGLIEAVENYDHRRGVAFSLYALHRIRGRMLNFLHKEGTQNLTYIDKQVYNGEYDFLEIETIDNQSPGIAEQLEKKYLVGELKSALHRLPSKEQMVLSGVYLEEQAPKDMAVQLEISTSHVYRLQKQGIRRIRGMMSKLMQHW